MDPRFEDFGLGMEGPRVRRVLHGLRPQLQLHLHKLLRGRDQTVGRRNRKLHTNDTASGNYLIIDNR